MHFFFLSFSFLILFHCFLFFSPFFMFFSLFLSIVFIPFFFFSFICFLFFPVTYFTASPFSFPLSVSNRLPLLSFAPLSISSLPFPSLSHAPLISFRIHHKYSSFIFTIFYLLATYLHSSFMKSTVFFIYFF